MDQIATALINLAAFVELSEDDVIDPDDAVRALEGVAADLHGISAEEVSAIRAAIERLLPSESDIQRRNFLAEFTTALGIEPEDQKRG